jgi:hypothetical protein
MAQRNISRRRAIATASMGALGTMAVHPFTTFNFTNTSKLALLGGEKVRTSSWPQWPVWDNSAEDGVIEMLRSGRWWRGGGEYVSEFEEEYARLMGASAAWQRPAVQLHFLWRCMFWVLMPAMKCWFLHLLLLPLTM